MDNELDLDTSWIEEEDKLENMNSSYIREPMEAIDIFFLYINKDDYIEKITCETHDISNNVLKKEIILQLIQQKKRTNRTLAYSFMDLLLYHVDLEPQHIQTYARYDDTLENSQTFLKSFSTVDDIAIPPSIFIFHRMNALYFLFKENEKMSVPVKSILKRDPGSQKPLNKMTKRVRLVIDKSHGATRKHRPESEE